MATLNYFPSLQAISHNERLKSDAWHGNALLSCGPHKLVPQQKLSEFNGELVACPKVSTFLFCFFELFNWKWPGVSGDAQNGLSKALIVEKLRFLFKVSFELRLVSPFLPVERRRKFFVSISASMCPQKNKKIEKSGCGSNIKTQCQKIHGHVNILEFWYLVYLLRLFTFSDVRFLQIFPLWVRHLQFEFKKRSFVASLSNSCSYLYPVKFNMDPEKNGFQKESPFPGDYLSASD